MDWKKESEQFNKAADYYDQYRPGYPQEIVDVILRETGIKSGSKIVEIGAGSGKATELFAGRDFDILCIEPGRDLAKIGADKFKKDSITFACSRFEDFHFTARDWDVVLAAQAFHWVPQPKGYEICADILRDGGYLAVFWNMYITYDNPLDRDLLALSNKYSGFADFLSENECEARIRSITSEIENSGLFSRPKVFRHLWRQTYTADQYFGFALTGNRFVQKSDAEKEAARRDIAALCQKYNGSIDRPYLCVLYVAQKR